MRSTAYVLGPFGIGANDRPTLPYGAQHLAGLGYDVHYADPETSAAYRLRPIRTAVRAAQRLMGSPALEPVLEPAKVRRADLLVCLLEDNIAVLAPALRLLRRRGRPSVLVVVWLAERVGSMSGRDRRRWRRRLRSFDRVIVLSANQVDLLTDRLDLPRGLVQVVPFGVEPQRPEPIPDSGAVLSVGGDTARDYPTFVAAMDGDDNTVVVTTAAHRAALGDAPGIEVIGPLTRDRYLALLRDATVVVSPTRPVAYPTGQTVVIESMQMGRPLVVTESAAIADYVTHGITALTVPAGSPDALRAAVDRLRTDHDLRQRLGAEAARVGARFTDSAMWAGIVAAIGS